MPDQRSGSQANGSRAGLPDKTAGNAHPAELRAARRMRQLASEIRDALERNDLNLARNASCLLAPTLAQWQAEHSAHASAPPEIMELAGEAKRVLDACSDDLAARMSRAAMEIRRLRKSQNTLAGMRRRRPAPALHRLDIRY